MSYSSVREDVAQRKSMNECSKIKVNFSGFPLLREYGAMDPV